MAAERRPCIPREQVTTSLDPAPSFRAQVPCASRRGCVEPTATGHGAAARARAASGARVRPGARVRAAAGWIQHACVHASTLEQLATRADVHPSCRVEMSQLQSYNIYSFRDKSEFAAIFRDRPGRLLTVSQCVGYAKVSCSIIR